MNQDNTMGLVRASVTITVYVEGEPVEFECNEMTVAQAEAFDRKANTAARKGWLARLNEIAGSLPMPEKQSLLVAAAASEPDLSSDRRAWAVSENGLKEAVLSGCPGLAKQWDAVNSNPDNGHELLRAWHCAMGIPVDPGTGAPAAPSGEAAAEGNP